MTVDEVDSRVFEALLLNPSLAFKLFCDYANSLFLLVLPVTHLVLASRTAGAGGVAWSSRESTAIGPGRMVLFGLGPLVGRNLPLGMADGRRTDRGRSSCIGNSFSIL